HVRPGQPLAPQQLENLRARRPAGPMLDREFPPHQAPIPRRRAESPPAGSDGRQGNALGRICCFSTGPWVSSTGHLPLQPRARQAVGAALSMRCSLGDLRVAPENSLETVVTHESLPSRLLKSVSYRI